MPLSAVQLRLPGTPMVPHRCASRDTRRWGTIGVITSAGVSGGRHGRRIALDPGGVRSQSQQHSTFKVTLGESGSLPPPLVPGSAANHARSASGSNGSARSRTMPSLMGSLTSYDAGGAVDALIGLSSYQGPSGLLAGPRTASVHSIASPSPHMRDAHHDAFPSPPSTTLPTGVDHSAAAAASVPSWIVFVSPRTDLDYLSCLFL
ncbi:hypothetical protein FRC09_005745, partial [Ceratobasidium sp. 395]